MKRSNQGFTLIELMIAVSIIGILSAIAIPQFQDYADRSKVAEIPNLMKGVKTDLQDHYAREGTMPADGDALDVAIKLGLGSSEFVSAVAGTYAADTITYTLTITGISSKNIGGGTIAFAFDGTQPVFEWDCDIGGTTLDDVVLPSDCK